MTSTDSPCPVCPRHHLYGPAKGGGVYVPPDGPQPSPVLFVGEGPAKDEAKRKRPFSGTTGQEFDDNLLVTARCPRESSRVTNATLCTFPGYRNPTRQEGQACLRHHLVGELLRTRPKFLVPMGAVACHTICPDIDLAYDYGLPLPNYSIPWADWEGTLIPMYHPSAGLYDQRFAIMISESFRNLRDILQDSFSRPSDPYQGREDYSLATSAADVWNYFHKYPGNGDVSVDTEYGKVTKEFYCLSVTTEDGTGIMVRRQDGGALQEVGRQLVNFSRYQFHNTLADHNKLTQVGIHLPWSRCTDSLLAAYNLGLPYLGLKRLSYRLLGSVMDDFDDLVEPYQLHRGLEYMERIIDHGSSHSFRELQPWLTKRQHTIDKKARACRKNVLLKDSDPKQVFEGWPREDRKLCKELFGPFPSAGIEELPLDQQVVYACSDSDKTGRLHKRLRRKMARIREEELLGA